jgi:WD40 repeat protein
MNNLTRYRRLLDQARKALAQGMPATAARFLARARKEPDCARRADAVELSRQLSRLLPHRGLADGWQHQVLRGHNSEVTSVAFSPDGRSILSGSCAEPPRLWDIADRRCRRFAREGPAGITAIAWGPDARFALSSSLYKIVRLWDVSTGRCRNLFQGHEQSVTSVAWGPGGQPAVSGSQDRTVRLWDVSTGRCIHTFQGPGTDNRSEQRSGCSMAYLAFLYITLAMRAIGVLSRGRIMAATLVLAILTFLLVGVVAVQQVRYLISLLLPSRFSHKDRVTSVAFSPDGSCVLSGSADETLRLWSVPSGRLERTFEGHTAAVTSVAWAHDGCHVLSGSADRALRLWNVSSGACVRILQGHKDDVTSVAISPDSRFALSGSADRTIRLWHLASGRCLQTFTGHTRRVTSVAFSPDGRFAVSGSADRTVHLWELDWELVSHRSSRTSLSQHVMTSRA